MAKPKNKNQPTIRLDRTAVKIAAFIFYLGLFSAAIYLVFFSGGSTQSGQLAPGETLSQTGFSHSLDLRVASKNVYPSSAVSIAQDLGVSDGVAKKIFSFKVAADGLTEYGLMTLPVGQAPAQGYPVLVFCHGYFNPAKYSTVADEVNDMQFFSQHGFAVLKPDFRGQGFSFHQGQATSAYYSIDYNTDLMSLLSAVKKTSYLNKNNLNLWGFSMGAYVAFRAAILSPDIKNLIILSGPVDSLKDMYLTYIPPSDTNNLNALKVRNEIFSKYGDPAENPSFWSAASPISFIGRLKNHIQIHVGLLDQVVPPQFSADLDQALSDKHIRHDYYTYPDGSHSLESERTLIWARALQALKPPAANPPA